MIEPSVATMNPRLMTLNGVGAATAGQLVVTAGEKTDRLHSEPAFAWLCVREPMTWWLR